VGRKASPTSPGPEQQSFPALESVKIPTISHDDVKKESMVACIIEALKKDNKKRRRVATGLLYPSVII
jgi:hypothetical protein